MPSYTFPNREYVAQVREGGSFQCQLCKEDLQAGAIVCPKCRSFQGWRWWIHTVGLSLPWITATIAAIFYVYPKIITNFTPLGKEIFLSLKYDFNTADVSVDFFNYGTRPVYIWFATLSCFNGNENQPTTSFNIENQFAGAALAPEVEHVFAFSLAGDASSAIDKPGAKCRISFVMNDFHGKIDNRVLPIAQMSFSVE